MRREDGFSLIEVIVAAMIIGVALVPLMQMMPGLIADDQADEATLQLGTVAVRKMEALTNSLRTNTSAVPSGASVCSDLPRCLLMWTVTTETSTTTQGVGALVDVSVTACVDQHGNGACDAGGPQIRYDAKVTARP
jgi:prepilin-type N-terminal cleavage/methylation domain-containing protein